ncbi:hypothetical protein KY284_010642 [Solanum tuberosum]|nr:hypothetical protein KY284_010642 [Solanum tuberosum]
MQFLITLGLVETLFDPSEDRVKRDLIGESTIKRSRVELVLFNEDMVDAAVRDGVNIGVGNGVDVGGGICASAGVGGCIGIGVGIGDGVGVTSCSRCSGFLCEKCKKHDDNTPHAGEALRFHEHYDFMDRIMDLGLYTNFKKRYDSISEEETTIGGRSLKLLLDEFLCDEDIIN